jgi:hypothetical protein
MAKQIDEGDELERWKILLELFDHFWCERIFSCYPWG